MKRSFVVLISGLLLGMSHLHAQSIKLEKTQLTPHQVAVSFEAMQGKQAVKVVKDSSLKLVDEPTFVRLNNVTFSNGTIEVNVLSRLLKKAPESARGFIGVAFRIDDTNSNYESIYIRPTNGRADDQIRRNHSIQYYSYPDYKFDRLQKETPEKYESYADMSLNEWITMKIIVKGQEAELN